MNKFPEGWTCPPDMSKSYPEVEKAMWPILKAKAKRVAKFTSIDYDDAVQEGRLALLMAMIGYETSKGPMEHYAGVIITNAYHQIVYKAMTQSRMPRTYLKGDDGNWEAKSMPPLSLDAMEESPGVEHRTPETYVQDRQLEEQARLFKMKMLNKLGGLELRVFVLKVNPTVAFLKMVKNSKGNINKPTNLHIAKYLNVGKNSIDWAIHKIRAEFVRLARKAEFSELFGDKVITQGWPVIHISTQPKHDEDFVSEVIAQRGLDPKPVDGYETEDDFYQKSGDTSRLIERYGWGAVLVLKHKGECRTVVCEGRFNSYTGEVHRGGVPEKIPVSWYGEATSQLNKGKRK